MPLTLDKVSELVEETAVTMAIANSGGEWASHYTEDQKNIWRWRAYDIIFKVVTKINEAYV